MLGHMLLLRESVLLADGERLEIELHDDLSYRLSWRGVVYENKRKYAFRSVEQLRYDFERDAQAA
jgi:hypothetical protein